MIRFKVVIPAYNAFPWIEKCLASIEEQTYRNFDVCIVDDASTQEEMRTTIKEYADRNGWKTVFSEANQGGLASIVKGVEALQCDDEDVLIFIDGDDWLIGPNVFEKLNKIYSEEDVWMTYGQHAKTNVNGTGNCAPLTFWEKFTRCYRKRPWKFSHLRTAKYFLWKNINDKDLRTSEGEYYSCTVDQAITFPMAEMAGNHIRFIPEVLYIYNNTTGTNVWTLRAPLQRKYEMEIRAKKKYKRLGASSPTQRSSHT